MGDALCLKFTPPPVPQVQGVMGGALCLMFMDPVILDAQDVTGGALFLRIRASWVTPCTSCSRTPSFSMHRTSPVVRCS